MVHFKQTISIITISASCLNIPLKRHRFFTQNKKARHNYVLYKKPTLKLKDPYRVKVKEKKSVFSFPGLGRCCSVLDKVRKVTSEQDSKEKRIYMSKIPHTKHLEFGIF